MFPRAHAQKQQEEQSSCTTKTIHQGKILHITQETLQTKEGKTTCYDKVHHPGAVAILPEYRPGQFLFIRQWRRAAGKILLEIPAGIIEEGEMPVECAQRELREEIGRRSHTLTFLGGIYTAPGFCDEYIHLFLAKDLESDPLWADDTDHIDIIPLSLEEALQQIHTQELIDAKTLSALLFYLARKPL